MSQKRNDKLVDKYLKEFYRKLLTDRGARWIAERDEETATTCHFCQRKAAEHLNLRDNYLLCSDCLQQLRSKGVPQRTRFSFAFLLLLSATFFSVGLRVR